MSQLLTLLAKVREFTSAINDLVKTRPSHAVESVNTATLDGTSKESIKTSVLTTVNSHIANKNNPHGVTLNSIGGVSKAYVDNALSETVSLSELPVSQFGDTGTDPLGVTSTGFTLRFTKVIQAYLQGTLGLIPAQDIVLSTIDVSPANKVFYIYLSIDKGILGYRTSLEKLPESDGMMYLGKIVTDSSQITSNTIERVTRIGIYRMSQTAQGSAMPTTAGNHTTATKIDPSWI